MARILNDLARGVYRRLGIRDPKQLAELDERVYPVTLVEPNLIELAELHHERTPTTNTCRGTSWASFDVTSPGAGQVLLVQQLSRGLYSISFRVETTETAVNRKFRLAYLGPAANLISELQFLIGRTIAAGFPMSDPLVQTVNLFVQAGTEMVPAYLQMESTEAPTAGTRCVGWIALLKHSSDVQPTE